MSRTISLKVTFEELCVINTCLCKSYLDYHQTGQWPEAMLTTKQEKQKADIAERMISKVNKALLESFDSSFAAEHNIIDLAVA